jgi:hypothetical protein
MARDTTDPTIKAAALADLLSGEQPAVVAQRYGLDRGLVKMWKQRYVTAGVTSDQAAHVTVMHRPAIAAQQLAIGDLIMENLRAKLLATQKIAEYATTPSWFDKQTAADVATLFEALDRSAIGILDRLAQRQSGADDQRDP